MNARSMQRSTIGTLPANGLANTGSKTPVFSKFRLRIPNQHHGISSPRVYISSIAPSFPFSSLLKHLTFRGQGVADELFLSDSSSSWTNHPTAVVCLPPRC
ncbi:hypothetical protein AVEN_162028-1 [Araneus ventricosus]|uniref:Uncharacterized protein n=1 Tax=Araneus ventricosus TaxID=182803 RepID=A0A4Y2F875_ARAVE|nr:hypothetical protein AVEN_162028-1 [Araneus ventricosus]